MEKPSYYSIITANVRYDNRLTDSEKLLFAEITALSNKYGYCTASNNYFAKLYEVTKVTISRRIKKLKEYGYLKVEFIRNGNEIKKRKLYPLTEMLRPINTNDNTPIDNSVNTPINTNVKENTTSINNTRLNNTSSSSEIPQQSNVYDFYQKNGFGIMRPIIIDQIKDWLNDFGENGEEVVIEALKEAVNQNVTNWSYTNAILKSWYNDNIKSIEDVQARKNKREKNNSSNENDDWLNSPERQQYLNAFDNGGLL
ncbi:DnaD domain protein [Staphylococcus caeli]|uniref:DnaD domain protein n=1 Tax=Staphylococcus caeli TaxID=2201815 RepID=A0A1D4PW91_9STAP|nr:DnaD domain protein [Staphylococcus caeli]SCT27227.1 DnaD domain protein [Staphylococcus caeli]SCT34701.1 DnaD domain protein [Staphylococcus caeli]